MTIWMLFAVGGVLLASFHISASRVAAKTVLVAILRALALTLLIVLLSTPSPEFPSRSGDRRA
jgi:hypothetical protein